MFENIYFDVRTFSRNEKFAACLGIPYTPTIHKMYKQNLKAIHKPIKSVPKVMLDEAYDAGWAGAIYGYEKIREQKPNESDLTYAFYIHNVAKPFIEKGKSRRDFARMKTEVGCYTEAFRKASDANIEIDIGLQGFAEKMMEENNSEITMSCMVRPYLNMRHDDYYFNPAWHKPKGYGWRDLYMGI